METADRILSVAEGLMQRGGYFGFSFQDIAKEVGIQKPSLYHHFPSKAALGRAVIARYRARMRAVADQLKAVDGIDPVSALKLYLAPMAEIASVPDAACLCGVLGGEVPSLPQEMQNEVRAFFEEHLIFLETLLRAGQDNGAFAFEMEPRILARLIFSAIEGAMIIKRSTADSDFFDEIVGAIDAILRKA